MGLASLAQLSEKQKEVLSKGLKFAPTPLRIPVPEIIIAVEEGLSKINSNDAKLSRNSIIGVLNKAIVPRSNITPEEIKAMKDYKKMTQSLYYLQTRVKLQLSCTKLIMIEK